MKRRGRSGGGKVFPLVLCFFGLFALLAVGILAQSTVAASQDENSTPENYENYNQSSEFVKPFQNIWGGMMIVAMGMATLIAIAYIIRRLI